MANVIAKIKIGAEKWKTAKSAFSGIQKNSVHGGGKIYTVAKAVKEIVSSLKKQGVEALVNYDESVGFVTIIG